MASKWVEKSACRTRLAAHSEAAPWQYMLSCSRTYKGLTSHGIHDSNCCKGAQYMSQQSGAVRLQMDSNMIRDRMLINGWAHLEEGRVDITLAIKETLQKVVQAFKAST